MSQDPAIREEVRKVRRAKNREAGHCTECSVPIHGATVLCISCLEKARQRSIAWRADKSHCKKCVQPRVPGYMVCVDHLKRPPRKAGSAEKTKKIQDDYRKGKGRYNIAVRSSLYRGFSWSISKEDYDRLIQQVCFYCLFPLTAQGTGLDRKDSSQGYSLDNVVPCCRECNHAKRDWFTADEMEIIGQGIREVKLWRAEEEAEIEDEHREMEAYWPEETDWVWKEKPRPGPGMEVFLSPHERRALGLKAKLSQEEKDAADQIKYEVEVFRAWTAANRVQI